MGFVPTMGAFHEGHRSLMRRARDERDVTVVSIFVNPLQFADVRDLETYPRDEESDLAAINEWLEFASLVRRASSMGKVAQCWSSHRS